MKLGLRFWTLQEIDESTFRWRDEVQLVSVGSEEYVIGCGSSHRATGDLGEST